jgi:hypothetical protein
LANRVLDKPKYATDKNKHLAMFCDTEARGEPLNKIASKLCKAQVHGTVIFAVINTGFNGNPDQIESLYKEVFIEKFDKKTKGLPSSSPQEEVAESTNREQLAKVLDAVETQAALVVNEEPPAKKQRSRKKNQS